VLVLWPSTKYIIRGKVVPSPKSGLWWILWVYVCLWLVCAPKCSNYTLTNLLFGLCKFVWIIELLANLPSPHPEALACPSTFEVLWIKERTPTPFPSDVFTFGLTVESIKELGGVSDPVIRKSSYWWEPIWEFEWNLSQTNGKIENNLSLLGAKFYAIL
jgi:hypothetical protein